MIVYLLKVFAGSAIFLGIYYFFLEKEKMYSFNRYYLLFSLLAIFVIPIIKIGQIEVVENPISEVLNPVYIPMSELQSIDANTTLSTAFSSIEILLVIYLTVSCILLIRFGIMVWLLFRIAKKHKTLSYNSSKLVLISDLTVPHSFFNYIFINKEEYENLPVEILIHEQEHVRKKHTFDVIFIELLIIIFWFNPFLYLFRQAIKLNHEFLADDAVLRQINDIQGYQSLLVHNIKKTQGLSLASQLNFSIVKKRFIMMNRSTSPTRALAKQIAVFPVFLLLLFWFSEKTIAQKEVVQDKEEIAAENTSIQKNTQGKNNKDEDGKFSFYAPATDLGATDRQMQEYKSIVERYKSTDDKSWWKNFKKDITPVDRNRLESIFLQMNRDQQKQQSVVFIKAMGTLPKKVPTAEQIESWKDPKMYGLWIDNKRVDNSILDNYQASDFSHFFESALAKNAKNYGKHDYQVDLTTNQHFVDFNKKKEAEKGTYRMIFYLGSHYTITNN